MKAPLKVWFLSPEVAPFAKTGGLADMAGSLPGTLRKLGVDVRVGLPCYRTVQEGHFPLRKALGGLAVPSEGGELQGEVLETETEDGVPVYLFDRRGFFDRAHLYGTPEGDYSDNLKRFAYFSRGALLFAKAVGFRFDVVHCHDWQTGLVPAYLKTLYQGDPFFSTAASVFTVHNMGYQGLFPAEAFSASGLPASEFHPEGVEYWGNLSLLKAGIVYGDVITTVSPRYSQEIQGPAFGLGMEALLRERSADLYGILNGADYSTWNPAADPHIRANYTAADTGGKESCKVALVQEMGLDERFLDRPVLAMVSRLAAHKGYDLLLEIAEEVVGLNAALVVLATGEEAYEQALGQVVQRFPDSVAVKIGFDDPLAHRIMAGADIFLAPSKYEPCGLTQIYALKYGTVPVVRATGGLDDTIQPFEQASGQGNGFKFAEYKAKDFLAQIKEALRIYDNKADWQLLVENGMRADFSWEKSAQRYVELYEKAKERK
ncbi:MAG: glycogen synthase GlgA [Thermodesulfobacteriota bacterium]|nr:glycogen synthase GlgA [Thermodesulfobacteriota bacterium]